MKKLSILLIGLLLVTGFAFAQEPTISGSATVTFGIDLDGNTTGFKNEGVTDLNLVWVSGTTEAGTEGWIKIADWDITFDDDDGLAIDDGTLTAGWMFDPVTITIYSAPAFSGGEAKGIGFEAADPVKDTVAVGLAAANTFQGLTFDVALGVADVTLLVASDGDWTVNAANDYVVGLEIGATAGPAVIAAGVYAGPVTGAMDIDFDLGVDLTLAEMVTIALGFDAAMPNGGSLAWDAAADIGLDVAGIGVDIGTYIHTPATELDMDLDVLLDLGGLVDALTFTELFQIQSLIVGSAALDWYSKTTLGYAVSDQVDVGAVFEIDDASVIDLEGTVTLTGFVENTVFTLKYTVDDIENSNGAITFAAKITLP